MQRQSIRGRSVADGLSQKLPSTATETHGYSFESGTAAGLNPGVPPYELAVAPSSHLYSPPIHSALPVTMMSEQALCATPPVPPVT